MTRTTKYARKQSGYASTHARHKPLVHACPLCNPGAPLSSFSHKQLEAAPTVEAVEVEEIE